jgi:Ser/Thr protein kinase RdoA (MazF antagonist)
MRHISPDIIRIRENLTRFPDEILEHLLQHDVAHGDLYAHNVLFDAAARHAYVCDFGAASDGVGAELEALTAACTSEDVYGRPTIEDVTAALM